MTGKALDTTPRRARRIRKAWQKINVMVLHTTDEALSLFTKIKLTSQHPVRRRAKQKTAHIYPNYPKLRDCCPHKNTNVITVHVLWMGCRAGAMGVILGVIVSTIVESRQRIY